MMNDIFLDHNFPTTFSYLYMIDLIFFYSGIIERNYKNEWDKAIKKYNANSHGILLTSGFKMKDVEKKNCGDYGFIAC